VLGWNCILNIHDANPDPDHTGESPDRYRKRKQTPNEASPLHLLLLGNTDGLAPSAGGLGVLTTDTESPPVANTTVSTHLGQELDVLTELVVDGTRDKVEVLAGREVALSVEEPGGDLVLVGVLHDGDDALKLFGSDITGTVGYGFKGWPLAGASKAKRKEYEKKEMQ